ncbi:UDP-N-acetylglucosamine 2-epimerase [Actinomadura sp. NEAU-AAG7]|uniref:UDP-N-acetylglucosamine 2-epimerase n=1 Tax=Actinomadura sp. NEAU-AAG7 TaxID=2839640 RepID=UPI001BE48F42|nr:UDP-N-acetylglucosamine 2-epimerase [Actinomadura sp. NEAU-AAG7]
MRQITTTAPLTYPAFLSAAEHAALLISDSGGIQEEASVLHIPLIVLRRATERPEALGARCALTNDPARLRPLASAHLAHTLIHRPTHRTSPFGDGRACARIADPARLIATGPSPHPRRIQRPSNTHEEHTWTSTRWPRP